MQLNFHTKWIRFTTGNTRLPFGNGPNISYSKVLQKGYSKGHSGITDPGSPTAWWDGNCVYNDSYLSITGQDRWQKYDKAHMTRIWRNNYRNQPEMSETSDVHCHNVYVWIQNKTMVIKGIPSMFECFISLLFFDKWIIILFLAPSYLILQFNVFPV